jgi:ADP-dependent phosphofructokinase/glucokinase
MAMRSSGWPLAEKYTTSRPPSKLVESTSDTVAAGATMTAPAFSG